MTDPAPRSDPSVLPARARRRGDAARLQQRWLRRLRSRHGSSPAGGALPRDAARRAATPKPCSCWMCGNPRRFFGETSLRERSAAECARRFATDDDQEPDHA